MYILIVLVLEHSISDGSMETLISERLNNARSAQKRLLNRKRLFRWAMIKNAHSAALNHLQFLIKESIRRLV